MGLTDLSSDADAETEYAPVSRRRCRASPTNHARYPRPPAQVTCWQEAMVLMPQAPQVTPGYFVEGAPINLTENIASVRKLVNGSPALSW